MCAQSTHSNMHVRTPNVAESRIQIHICIHTAIHPNFNTIICITAHCNGDNIPECPTHLLSRLILLTIDFNHEKPLVINSTLKSHIRLGLLGPRPVLNTHPCPLPILKVCTSSQTNIRILYKRTSLMHGVSAQLSTSSFVVNPI